MSEIEDSNPNFKLFSDIHKDVQGLIASKDATVKHNADRLERRDIVHAFTNLRDTMTEDEKEELGREEITNFGSTFRNAQVNISPLESIVIGTDSLVEVTVDTNNPARDHLISVEIASRANKWFFTGNEKFHQFWRTAVGEGHICGGGVASWDEADVGLFPKYRRNFLFPKDSPLDPEEMTYAFELRSMTIGQLEELLEATDNDDDQEIDVQAVRGIIDDIKMNVQGRGTNPGTVVGGTQIDNSSAREDQSHAPSITFDMWIYYEVRSSNTSEDGGKHVSKIIFLDGAYVNASAEKRNASAVISQTETAFKDALDWLVTLVFDEEIGGEKTVDTLRGLAEAYYKPAVLIEELRNVEVEGAMQSARITLQELEGANPDEVLDFELGRDLFAPKNVQALQLPNTGSSVRPVVADLLQTVSGISSSDQANTRRGQELRQQAVERQANSDQLRTNRTIKGYLKVDKILENMVTRAMLLTPKEGTEDYRAIKGFQRDIDRAIVHIYKLDERLAEREDFDFEEDDNPDDRAMRKAKKIREKLAKRHYGKSEYLVIKARRNAVGLDRPTEVENAAFILRVIETGRVPAQNVPFLLERAIAYQTQNADIAALVASPPQLIKDDQLKQAAMEWDVIGRRALIGEIYPIGARDIDADHVEAHTLDLISDVNQQGVRPWDQLDVVKFTARVQHTAAHIQRMRSRSESTGAAREAMMELQEVVAQAGGIIQALEEQRVQNENEELSPDDRLKLAREQLVYAQIEMLGRQFGVNLAKERDVAQQRVTRAQQNQQRMNLMERGQLAREIQSDRDFRLRAAETLMAPVRAATAPSQASR